MPDVPVPGTDGNLWVPGGISSRAAALIAVPVWPLDDGRRVRGRAQVAAAGRRAALEAGPGRGGLVASLSARHAEQVWKTARAGVAAHAAELAGGAEVQAAARPGLWQLAFVGAVGAHVAACARCGTAGRYGREGDTPERWLSWALQVTPEVADVWGAVARRSGVRLDRQPPRPWITPER